MVWSLEAARCIAGRAAEWTATDRIFMERTMSERIRYAWGGSSLGDFIAAMSDKGLVMFEFGSRGGKTLDRLRELFPDANLELDEDGLAETVGKLADVVEHPDHDPGIPLDLRGTAFERKVWEIVREIPPGTATNYGAIAAEMGTPRDARAVTDAIVWNSIAILVPCHRVVKKDGSLSGYRWGAKRKRELLDREQRSLGLKLSA
jgi:AraC family transcriptional regulator, regulatory protein of adaptative response / methylated-DNA-[protein]-cysteine methyltransferase